MEDLDRGAWPEDARKKRPILTTLDCLSAGRNVILAGHPGTGTTHLAIGRGMAVCLADDKVGFTTVPTLSTQLQERRSAQTLHACRQKFETYDLVICDAFGSLSFEKAGAELLVTHLS